MDVGTVRPAKRPAADTGGPGGGSKVHGHSSASFEDTMHVTFRLPYLTGMLLLAATPFAAAESPLPDPIAPAVI
ncbi:MAG TPA: hypothetical protein VEB23_11255, partial [Ramlibacter sp.]|nr:hypothetical protein [Ramlibacter sp.]